MSESACAALQAPRYDANTSAGASEVHNQSGGHLRICSTRLSGHLRNVFAVYQCIKARNVPHIFYLVDCPLCAVIDRGPIGYRPIYDRFSGVARILEQGAAGGGEGK